MKFQINFKQFTFDLERFNLVNGYDRHVFGESTTVLFLSTDLRKSYW